MSEMFDISAEVKSAIPAVLEKMRQNIIDKMVAEAESVAMAVVREEVRKWAIEELAPEVRAQLDAGKEGLVAQAATIAETLGKAIGASLQESAEKSLASGYVVKEIAEKLFRGY